MVVLVTVRAVGCGVGGGEVVGESVCVSVVVVAASEGEKRISIKNIII